ncbi:MAG: BTAD domain-containing putative transcriptional regulator [Nocardiopsaceae bacterium]|nr:BTAD domain-containing putative transcriptional regulator [Nocardiopsaceae bacterium]
MADISFGVLGQLTVQAAGTPIRLRGNKRRVLLATLLLRANRTVPVSDLVERMWGDVSPEDCRGALQVQVTRLRSALGEAGGGALIVCGLHGYRVELDDYQSDLLRLRALVLLARDAEHRGDLVRSCDALGEAMDLWRGPVLTDVVSDVLHEHDVSHVELELLRMAEQRFAAALALGRHEQVIGPLTLLAARHPQREALVRMRMIALYRCGRQSEALEVYRRTRRILADRLGVDPGRELQETFQGVLRGDLEDCSVVPRQRESSPSLGIRAPQRTRSAPAQLPADVPGFIGRGQELAELDRLLDTGAAAGRVLISGPPGSGCTALAIHWAHGAAERFPDGQLYVDLRGDTAVPRSPSDVLRRFLRACGVDGGLPAETDERAALLRSVLASRRLLMVLDNAYSAAQVRPLMPGTSACGVIVTSRYWLADLIAREGVPVLPLDKLPPWEAAMLLRDLIGAERAAAEPGAVCRLTEAAEGLPLPLRMAAAWLVTHSQSRIETLVSRVEARRERTAVERVERALVGDPRFLMGNPGTGGGNAWRE